MTNLDNLFPSEEQAKIMLALRKKIFDLMTEQGVPREKQKLKLAEIAKSHASLEDLVAEHGEEWIWEKVVAWHGSQTSLAAQATPKPVASSPTAKPATQPRERIAKIPPLLIEATTLTGISLNEITLHLNKRYDADEISKIPFGIMAGKTDLKWWAARQRLDSVFGPQGIGWVMVPSNPTVVSTIINAYPMESDKGRKYTQYEVTLLEWVFRYRIITASVGGTEWIESSVMTDSDSNEELSYAARGATTSLMKQALRGLGGIDQFMDKDS